LEEGREGGRTESMSAGFYTAGVGTFLIRKEDEDPALVEDQPTEKPQTFVSSVS